MHTKRYSVFISSTFEDLKEERQAVQDVVIRAGDFPVQMESFPAADEDQFAFIKTLIDKCDYYLLIVAGRYGSTAEDGISYTEKEYRYAVSHNIPVLVMLHGNRGSISADKTEDSTVGKKRLAAFIADIQTNRLRKTWTTHDGLKLAVREALDHAKATKPGVGWVRGDTLTSFEAMEELNEVRKENAKYRDAIGSLEIELALPPMPSADAVIAIDLLPHAGGKGYGSPYGSTATINTTWIAAFPVFYSNLKWANSDYDGDYSYYVDADTSCIEIGSAIAGEVEPIDTAKCFKISKATLQRLTSFYIEAGLMNPQGADKAFTDTANRVARRHNIVGQAAGFGVMKGSIKVTSASAAPRADLEDEIPF